MIGREFSARTVKRVASIEAACELIAYLSGQLRYLQPPVSQLIGQAARYSQFTFLDYLGQCAKAVSEGKPFPQSWDSALKESRCDLDKEDRLLLRELGNILGASDLETQVGSLELLQQRLRIRLSEADTNRQKYGKMYQALGFLGGLAIAIVIA